MSGNKANSTKPDTFNHNMGLEWLHLKTNNITDILNTIDNQTSSALHATTAATTSTDGTTPCQSKYNAPTTIAYKSKTLVGMDKESTCFTETRNTTVL
jgi:hypothetical protein